MRLKEILELKPLSQLLDHCKHQINVAVAEVTMAKVAMGGGHCSRDVEAVSFLEISYL